MNDVLTFLQQNAVGIAVTVVPVVVGVVMGTRKAVVASLLKESGEVMTSLGVMVEHTSAETVRKVFTEASDFRDALKKLSTTAGK